jgi:hypothetical protein
MLYQLDFKPYPYEWCHYIGKEDGGIHPQAIYRLEGNFGA